jgi:hypothetical protein
MFIISRFVSVSVLSLWVSLLAMTCSGGPKDKLQVRSIGLGTLMPNYSNADLQIGANYRMTAIAGPGNRFQKWIVATNWDGGVPKATPILYFTMRSNLTLTAVFVDVDPPAVRVTTLGPNQRINIPVSSNAVFTVRGTAQDNVSVSNVWYRLNDGAWAIATGTDAWTAPLLLSQPANLFQVFAEDAAGNHSPTCSVRFAYAASDYLTLQTNGLGGISCLFKGNLLELGRKYTVFALPNPGQLFSGWSGDISTAANPLSFAMRSNMVLTANFVPNPFPALWGNYNGLFYPADRTGGITDRANATNSGFFSLTLVASGGFSGKLVMGGANLPFSGALSLDLQSQITVPQPGSTPLTINLGLDPDFRIISGTVGRGDQWTSSLLARAAAVGQSNSFAGTYTLLLEGCDDDGACFSYAKVPYGDSPASVRVTSFGAIQMVGTLADGASISHSTTVSANGYWPLYVAPYGGRGILIGWLSFVDYGGVSMVVWAKAPSAPGDSYYADGFSSPRAAALTPYTRPPSGQNAVNWTNGMVVVDSGDLPVKMTNQVAVVNNQLQTLSGSISNLTLAITPGSGLFQGSFVHPQTGRQTAFHGALVQSPSNSYYMDSGGWFLGPSGAGGTIRLKPSDP